MRFLRFTVLFIGLSFSLNLISSSLEHVFHDHQHETHTCEADFCFIDKEYECSDSDQFSNKKYHLDYFLDNRNFIQREFVKSFNVELTFLSLIRIVSGRGPPMVN